MIETVAQMNNIRVSKKHFDGYNFFLW